MSKPPRTGGRDTRGIVDPSAGESSEVAVPRDSPSSLGTSTGPPARAKPRVLFVSRTRYRLPLSPGLARKWDALADELDLLVLASSAGGPSRLGTFVLSAPRGPRSLSGGAEWLLLPARLITSLRRFRPDVVIAQSPYEAAAALLARRLTGSNARILSDVQGDWRTATRLYGGAPRRLLSPLADRVATSALRRVDGVRTISPYTTRIVGEIGLSPAATFPTYFDLDAFTGRDPVEPPERPHALFVGVLEAYKNIDGLAAAWQLVQRRLPDARLLLVGTGTRTDVAEHLVREHAATVSWAPRLEPDEVARALDAATVLVLPSRSEGMGRVIIESFCRERPVIGSRVGGIPDLVEDGANGLLVDPGSTDALADAIVQLLEDRELARTFGRAGRRTVEPWLQSPQEFARRTRLLVEEIASG